MLEVECPAKLNLWLRVLRRRPDGYHDIESVACLISLADHLLLSTSPDGIRLTCSDSSVPSPPHNLAWRAADAFISAAFKNSKPPGVCIHIQKRIPMQAGMGGASTDAAGTLMGLNQLLGEPLDNRTLVELAQQLGSDVPLFFVKTGAALMRGRGEILEPLPSPSFWAVVVKPPFGVDTGWAYRNCTPSEQGPSPRDLLNALASGDIEKAGKLLHNDLQEAVERFHPEIAGLRSELMRAGARGALMTGSGSAVFGLAANRSEAEEIARRLPPDCGTVFVVSSLGAPEDERNG